MQLLPLPSIYFKFNPGSNTELTSEIHHIARTRHQASNSK